MNHHFQLDINQVKNAFNKAANQYDKHATLQQEVEQRLLARIFDLELTPNSILDIGAGTSKGSQALSRQFTDALIVPSDLAYNMLSQNYSDQTSPVVANFEQLPLKNHYFDLIYSNLALQWANDLGHTLNEIKRVINPEGYLFFTTFGPSTLSELRYSWSKVSTKQHINQFIDIKDIGNALLSLEFIDPVMDKEEFTVFYQDVYQLMRELKNIGANNAASERSKKLMGKNKMLAMIEEYNTLKIDGKIPVTYEIFYGFAKAPKNFKEKSNNLGTKITIPINTIKTRKK